MDLTKLAKVDDGDDENRRQPQRAGSGRGGRRKHSTMGKVSVGMALAAGVLSLIGIPAKEAAGGGTVLVVTILLSCVAALCIVGVCVAVAGLVSKRRSPLLPAMGLVLNPVVAIAFGVFLWWPNGTSLVVAADNGDADTVRWTLGMGVNVDAVAELKERDGTPFVGNALVAASRNGQAAAVDELLTAGAKVDTADSRDRTPLYHAVTMGHAAVADKLLKHKANPNLSPGPRTPLYFAAASGNVGLVERMLAQGAKAGVKEFPPLLTAAEAGHTKIVELLLGGSADLDAVDAEGNTALHIAAGKGHLNVIQLLLRKQAKAGALNKYGETALEMALAAEHKAVVDSLINVGSPQDIFAAVALNDLDRVQKELEADAKLVTATKRDLTPLHVAARRGHLEIVLLLIEKGATVNAKAGDGHGLTPLHLATRGGHLEVVKTLIASMADVNQVVTADGVTAPPLYHAVISGFSELLDVLLAAGADVNARCDTPPPPGSTIRIIGSPLMFAVIHQRHAIAQRLIDAKADIEYRPRPGGPTPLYEAVRNADEEMVKLLLRNKASVHAQVGGQSLTTVIEEKQRGHQKAEALDRIFSLLRDHGALD